MKLTKKQALELHRQMWTDMQNELGDNPSSGKRIDFKLRWCREHFPEERIESGCFLCEYTRQYNDDCDCCPIKWDEDERYDYCGGQYDYCGGQHVSYERSPISEILALPEREDEDG